MDSKEAARDPRDEKYDERVEPAAASVRVVPAEELDPEPGVSREEPFPEEPEPAPEPAPEPDAGDGPPADPAAQDKAAAQPAAKRAAKKAAASEEKAK